MFLNRITNIMQQAST